MPTLKTFNQGSEFPALEDGTLRIYSMRFCPYAQRTRLVLIHKKIPHETVNVNLKKKPEWFVERNPLGLVPTLEKDGQIVYESLVTCDYLDEVYPEEPLNPRDPYKRAKDKMLLDRFSQFPKEFFALARSQGKDTEALEKVNNILKLYEQALCERGEFYGGDQPVKLKFLSLYGGCLATGRQVCTSKVAIVTLDLLEGEKPCMVDYMIWPFFERILMFQVATNDKVILITEADTPKLHAWMESMQTLPAVKETMFDVETHLRFAMSNREGEPLYDLGL